MVLQYLDRGSQIDEDVSTLAFHVFTMLMSCEARYVCAGLPIGISATRFTVARCTTRLLCRTMSIKYYGATRFTVSPLHRSNSYRNVHAAPSFSYG